MMYKKSERLFLFFNALQVCFVDERKGTVAFGSEGPTDGTGDVGAHEIII